MRKKGTIFSFSLILNSNAGRVPKDTREGTRQTISRFNKNYGSRNLLRLELIEEEPIGAGIYRDGTLIGGTYRRGSKVCLLVINFH